MIEVGSRIRTNDGSFEGRVLGRHGSAGGVGGSYEYRSLPEDLNISVYAVLHETTGEVRFYVGSALKLAS